MVEDLSRYEGPITNLFPRLKSRDDWENYALSDEQLRFYEENGYVSGVRVLGDEQVGALRDELKDMMNPDSGLRELFHEYNSNESEDPNKVLFHALGAWRAGRGFHDLLWNPAVTVPMAQILAGGVRFWHDQLFCKPAHHGGVVAWHQDYSYWTRTVPMMHLTCWIGLDDSTRDNGCLMYIPESHKWDLLPMTGLAGDMEAIHSVLSEEQKEQFKPVPIELKKGEASFHHPLMIHGSGENKTDRPRRAAVVNTFRDGTISDQDDAMLPGQAPIPKGQKMEGQFFPLLIDPDQL